MHIVDGALSTEIVVLGGVLATAGVARGLKDLTLEKVPAAGVLAATFFVASLVNVPLGPSSVHLIMGGLAGLVLGWAAFPALLVGLALQAVFFGFGGLMVLGVNLLNIALPAVLLGMLCRRGVTRPGPRLAAAWGALAGFGATFLTAILVSIDLALTGEEFVAAAQLVVISHLAVALIEGAVCAAAVVLIRKVKPELFGTFAPGETPATPASEGRPAAQPAPRVA